MSSGGLKGSEPTPKKQTYDWLKGYHGPEKDLVYNNPKPDQIQRYELGVKHGAISQIEDVDYDNRDHQIQMTRRGAIYGALGLDDLTEKKGFISKLIEAGKLKGDADKPGKFAQQYDREALVSMVQDPEGKIDPREFVKQVIEGQRKLTIPAPKVAPEEKPAKKAAKKKPATTTASAVSKIIEDIKTQALTQAGGAAVSQPTIASAPIASPPPPAPSPVVQAPEIAVKPNPLPVLPTAPNIASDPAVNPVKAKKRPVRPVDEAKKRAAEEKIRTDSENWIKRSRAHNRQELENERIADANGDLYLGTEMPMTPQDYQDFLSSRGIRTRRMKDPSSLQKAYEQHNAGFLKPIPGPKLQSLEIGVDIATTPTYDKKYGNRAEIYSQEQFDEKHELVTENMNKAAERKENKEYWKTIAKQKFDSTTQPDPAVKPNNLAKTESPQARQAIALKAAFAKTMKKLANEMGVGEIFERLDPDTLKDPLISRRDLGAYYSVENRKFVSKLINSTYIADTLYYI
jgi:hypothetical protein